MKVLLDINTVHPGTDKFIMDAASESSPILMEHTCTLYIHVKDDFQL